MNTVLDFDDPEDDISHDDEHKSPVPEEIERVFAAANKKLRASLKEIEDSGRVEKEYINGVAVYFRKRAR